VRSDTNVINADTGLQYPQAVNIAGMLAQMNLRFDQVNQRLDRSMAQASNNRILMFNRLLPGGVGLRPLVKEASGLIRDP
jgi:hypothetical protein